MKSLREIRPAGAGRPGKPVMADEESESTPQQSSSSSSTKKRAQTRIACTSCRRRKSKCDGGRPVCTLCAASGRRQCEYDGDPDLTRTAALRKKHDELQRRNELFDELFHALLQRPEDESVEILRWMRRTTLVADLEELVRLIRHGDLLVQLSATGSAKLLDNNDERYPTPPEVLLASDKVTSLLASLNDYMAQLAPASRPGFRLAFKDRVDELPGLELLDGVSLMHQPAQDPEPGVIGLRSPSAPASRPRIADGQFT